MAVAGYTFQSTLPVRGATGKAAYYMLWQDISIHAPRAGSDAKLYRGPAVKVISIHAPRAGSDPYIPAIASYPKPF